MFGDISESRLAIVVYLWSFASPFVRHLVRILFVDYVNCPRAVDINEAEFISGAQISIG